MGPRVIERKITPHDRRRADRLRAVWQLKKRELDLTQVRAAKVLGITQASFSQYLNCGIALNTDMILSMAKLLRVDPAEIDPDMKSRLAVVRTVPTTLDVPVVVALTGRLRGPNMISAKLVKTNEHDSFYAVLVDDDSFSAPKGSYLIASASQSYKPNDQVLVTFTDSQQRSLMKFVRETQRSFHFELRGEPILTEKTVVFSVHRVVAIQFPE